MKIEVEMRAFGDGKIRVVEVPANEAEGESEAGLLDLAFKWGQNDFQPQQMPSVSVGDVVRVGGKRFLVEGVGFAEVREGEHHKCATCGEIYAALPECPAEDCGRPERQLCEWVSADKDEDCYELATGAGEANGEAIDACGEHRAWAY